MTNRVLVVGHADADGHVIAEQVRRNLSRIPSFEVTTVVDPVRTKNHKTWTKLGELHEVEGCAVVVFVDLMFAPASFAAEADALVSFAQARPATRFYVLDHHPLPLGRLAKAPNLRALYREDVFDCTLGSPSPMMVIAALCEKQPTRVESTKTPEDVARAEGMRRAAAPGGPLAGEKLSALLRADRWEDLALLGREDREFHYLPRGHRSATAPLSPALKKLNKTATDLLKRRPPNEGRTMSYDSDSLNLDAGAVYHAQTYTTAHSRDLETIVTLLELAALSLTTTAGATFSRDELLAEARSIGGPRIDLQGDDVDIVLGKSGFLKAAPGKKYRLK